MQASDVMSSPVHVVLPNDSVAHARNQMLRYRCSRLPVVDGDELAGIITKKDLGYRLRQAEPTWRRRPIDRVPASLIMTANPVSVAAHASIRTVAAAMMEFGISGLPVVEDRTLVGIVTKTDLLGSVSVEGLEGTVGDLMGDVVTISRYHSLDHVIDLASERDDRLVVVNNDGTLAGIITESNLAFYEYARPGAGRARPRRDHAPARGAGGAEDAPICARRLGHRRGPDDPARRDRAARRSDRRSGPADAREWDQQPCRRRGRGRKRHYHAR